MAKRKKKKATKAPAMRKKKTAGKRKVAKPKKSNKPLDLVKGLWVIDGGTHGLLRLSAVGEKEFATEGAADDFLRFTSKAEAKAEPLPSVAGLIDVSVKPANKFFATDHNIDLDTLECETSIKWVSEARSLKSEIQYVKEKMQDSLAEELDNLGALKSEVANAQREFFTQKRYVEEIKADIAELKTKFK